MGVTGRPETRGAEPRDRRDRGASQRLQWLGLALAPAAFAVHLLVGYALVPWSCVRQNDLWVHLSGVASVVLALLGVWCAWRAWHDNGGGDPTEQYGPAPRTRFLGVAGTVTSAVIALILAAQWAAAFFITPCQT